MKNGPIHSSDSSSLTFSSGLTSSAIFSLILTSLTLSGTGSADISINYSVNPGTVNHPISPLIYGTNIGMLSAESENPGFFCLGGNRFPGYNRENNYSNAGIDYIHHSDTHINNQAHDPAKSMITLQMAGYVATDNNGTVEEYDKAPSYHWKEVVPAKGSAFTTSPNPNGNYVYMDEQVNFLVNHYGRADQGGVRAYSLNNEPTLWFNTHPRINQASQQDGVRLLDTFDTHWYTEVALDDEHHLTNENASHRIDHEARVQAPRTLWQEGYTENSWIGQWKSHLLPLIPELQASVDRYYPETGLSISEYKYGGGNDISGGIAQADVLGIFAKYDLHPANLWLLQQHPITQTVLFIPR